MSKPPMHDDAYQVYEGVRLPYEGDNGGNDSIQAPNLQTAAKAPHDVSPETPVPDPVNRPAHYTSLPNSIECIDVVEHRNFNVGNAIKYLWRSGLKQAGNKEKQIEDLRKSIWYSNREIERLNKYE